MPIELKIFLVLFNACVLLAGLISGVVVIADFLRDYYHTKDRESLTIVCVVGCLSSIWVFGSLASIYLVFKV